MEVEFGSGHSIMLIQIQSRVIINRTYTLYSFEYSSLPIESHEKNKCTIYLFKQINGGFDLAK